MIDPRIRVSGQLTIVVSPLMG